MDPIAREEEALRRLCDWVQGSTGIQLGPPKHSMARMRLESRLREMRYASIADYYEYLRTEDNGDELSRAIDVLTTNKTSFFRESRHFRVLDERMQRAAVAGRELRLWSAGCSSGEEAYTMAMVAQGAGAMARILATDLSTQVLAKGREGLYERDIVEEVPPHLRSVSFEREGDRYRVTASLRTRVDFARLNLLDPWPMKGPFDAIFCRNVMIYFDRPVRAALVARFREKLAPDGLLFVGLSESLSGIDKGFRWVEPGVYAP